jgi:hypothetical protein
MDASIKYIVDKIEEIEVEGHNRFQTGVSIDLAGRSDDNKKDLKLITIKLDEILDNKVKIQTFYRKWNFKLFEVLKEIFDTGETSVYEKTPNVELTFKNSICDYIHYHVYSLHIILPMEYWNAHHLKIQRDNKLRELGL